MQDRASAPQRTAGCKRPTNSALLIRAKSTYPFRRRLLAVEEIVANAVLSKIASLFSLIVQADDLLEGSWRRRDWATFVQTWLVASIAVAVIAFLMPFLVFMVPALLYDLVALFMKTRTIPISWTEATSFGLRFGGMVGVFFLVSTIPMMLFKQISGDWEMTD
jgi:hypothetical protein